ncbi:MAG: zf-TFIIB domain-containing protein [Pseudomonadota bacterium]
MKYQADLHSLQCPKCSHGMEEITYGEVTIDRCTNCRGIWFDTDEAHQLKQLEGSEALDVGDATEGWKWDSHADIDCPHCGKRLDKLADPQQKHIWYEVCPEHGMFMDAGEFKDFKEESVLDFFRSLVKGRRDVVAP